MKVKIVSPRITPLLTPGDTYDLMEYNPLSKLGYVLDNYDRILEVFVDGIDVVIIDESDTSWNISKDSEHWQVMYGSGKC